MSADNQDASGEPVDPSEPAGDAGGSSSDDTSAFSDLVDGIEIDANAIEAEVDADVAAASAAPVDPLTAVTAERDGYLEALQRLKAEFDNHRKRTSEQAVQQRQQAAAGLVEKLLPVLDACTAARAHDAEGVGPIHDQLLEVLTSGGMSVLDPLNEPFDPDVHDAVMHEEGDAEEVPVVAEVLRTGYVWNGRVIRPAMVKVRG